MKIIRRCFILSLELLVAFFPFIIHADWEQSNGPSGLKIKVLAISGETIFAGSEKGLFKSTNNGINWSRPSGVNGTFWWPSITAIAVKGDTVFAGSEGNGIYFSTDRGITWIQTNTGLTSFRILCLIVSGENVFAGTNGGGVFLSSNNRSSWTKVSSGLTDSTIQCFAVNGNKLLAGTNLGGVFATSNGGVSWTVTGNSANGLFNTDIRSLATIGNNLFAGTYGAGIFQSSDNGITWDMAPTGINVVDVLLAIDNKLYIGGRDHLVTTLDTLKTFLYYPIPASNRDVLSFALNNKKLYVGTSDGVFKFPDDISTPTMVNSGLSYLQITAFANCGTNLFASANDYGVFISKDSGASWNSASYGIRYSISSVAATDKNVFATSSMGIYRSVDTCAQWNTSDSGLSYDINTVSVAVSRNNVYVGTAYGGAYKSTDNGEIWSPISCLGSDMNIKLLKANENYIFAINSRGETFKLTANENCGQRLYVGIGNKEITSLAVNTKIVLAGTKDSCIYQSTDNGTSWIPCSLGLTNKFIVSLATNDSYVFAGTSDSCIYVSPINNIQWTKINVNPNKFPVGPLTVFGGYLIVGSYGCGVWRIPLLDIIGTTDIISQNMIIQREDSMIRYLNNNSEVATIKFTLPYSGHVSVKIYNMSGQEIVTLADKWLQSGAHSLSWKTNGIVSGCYVGKIVFCGKNYNLRMMVSK